MGRGAEGQEGVGGIRPTCFALICNQTTTSPTVQHQTSIHGKCDAARTSTDWARIERDFLLFLLLVVDTLMSMTESDGIPYFLFATEKKTKKEAAGARSFVILKFTRKGRTKK